MSSFAEKSQNLKTGARKFFRRLAMIILLVFVLVMLFFYYGTYSTGVRAGIILKVSEKGTLFKTKEGQLDLLSFGAVKSENQLSQTFEFSVEKDQDSLYSILEEVALTGERIRLRYEEKYVVLPWRGDTKYFVIGVERTEKPASNIQDSNRFPE